jgi:hypothetical protein
MVANLVRFEWLGSRSYNTGMINHVIDFIFDFFTNLNIRKILGGILVLVGIAIINRMGSSGDPNKAILYAIGGILVGGVGFVVIYYDIAKDKASHGHDELGTLTKAYGQKEREKIKVSGWHMDQGSDQNGTNDNKYQSK